MDVIPDRNAVAGDSTPCGGIVETPRLVMRQLRWGDYAFLCEMLGDARVMYAWEHPFTKEEVEEWVERNLARYRAAGHAYYLVQERDAGMPVGVCGLLQEQAGDEQVLGVGYIFQEAHWGKGYAAEAAGRWMKHAFSVLGAAELTAQIRPENTASIGVARRLGMAPRKEFTKHYRGKDMLHILYSRKNPAMG